MNNQQMREAFSQLSTPLVADACVRIGLAPRLTPSGIRPLQPGKRLAGQVLPAQHYGSVDIFLEAMQDAENGDVLVIGNGGRTDEACIGDLTVLEARAWGLAGVVVWGCHRDTAELNEIGFPVFSSGTCPAGPSRLDPREPGALRSVLMGGTEVTRDDIAIADDDGVLFVASERIEEVLTTARGIWQTERKQAEAIRSGRKLYDQFRFKDYLAKRAADPAYSLRTHLRASGGAIEE